MFLLKAVCFAFDFVREWRLTIQTKAGTKNVMDKLTFCSKKLFYMPTAVYIRSSQTTNAQADLHFCWLHMA